MPGTMLVENIPVQFAGGVWTPVSLSNEDIVITEGSFYVGWMESDATPPIGVDLVLVDGEDWGKTGHIDYYMLGSKEFARRAIRDKYRFGIVVDMVGDKYQNIYREQISERFYLPLIPQR